MTDLDRLIAAVEAGGFWDDIGVAASACKRAGIPTKAARSVRPAYHGSLDAALALHEALLPGWLWCITPLGRVEVFQKFGSPSESGFVVGNPSRAWLLSILRAYRSMQEEA